MIRPPFCLTTLAYGFLLTAACGLAITGTWDDTVREEMCRQVETAAQIPALMADPKNETMIASERRWQADFTREFAETLAAVHQINRRSPLLPDIFPEPAKAYVRLKFAESYRVAIGGFQRQLHAGGLPTTADIEAAQRDIAEQVAREEEKSVESAAALRLPPPQRANSAPIDPQRYAQVMKARRIRCYAEQESFHRSPLYAPGPAPLAAEIWFAQVGLWIQQDVVAAIAELNEEAARSGPQVACVEQMPVKRIVRLRVLGYRLADRLLPFPELDTATGIVPDAGAPSPTGRMCDAEFDVVLFRLVAVVDQRDLLQLIDRISKQNFCVCTQAAYAATTPADAAAGFLYGGEPTVRVTLEFETYLARGLYQPLMPAAIRELLGAEFHDEDGCPQSPNGG